MRTDRFRTGDLAWLRAAARDGEVAWALPPGRVLRPGRYFDLGEGAPVAVTVIRRARCGDYSAFHQRSHTHIDSGETLARYYSKQSWLVLIAGEPWLVKDKFLNKRLYKARKPKT